MRILKFGGSSVASPVRIRRVCDILESYYQDNIEFGVVFSALGGVTDQLLMLCDQAKEGDKKYKETFNAIKERHYSVCRELLEGDVLEGALSELQENHENFSDLIHGIYLVRELSPRMKDHVVSFGERNAAYIISCVLNKMRVPAAYLDARKVVKTDDSFGRAKVELSVTNKLISEYFKSAKGIQVITGFIGSTMEGITSTLGRGGSDFTAAIFGAALTVERIEIWTDVSGVLTANPKKVPTAKPIKRMTYGEAMEMSHFGAKVIYPPTIVPALTGGIPVVIKNTFEPDHPGTLIDSEGNGKDQFVKGISSIEQIALVTVSGLGMVGVPGIAGRLFSALAKDDINIILITQASSEQSITFAINMNDAQRATTVIKAEFEREIMRNEIDQVLVEEDVCIVAVIGDNMKQKSGLAQKIFSAFGRSKVNIIAIAQGSSERNVSIVVREKDESRALNALHYTFFEDKPMKLFVAGVGNVGAALLDQIAGLRTQERKKLAIHGLSNSKRMVLSHFGLSYNGWREELDNNGEDLNPKKLVEFILSQKKAAFIDNTASDSYVRYYPDLLRAGISICTPNKVALSSVYDKYKNLKELAQESGAHLGFETNVGAGLPVISTLRSLINSGDEILKIEGVLSGTLSFLWNHFDGSKPFSAILKEAHDMGYTEPDPREDLRGNDVKRKLVILARESGEEIEMQDISIDPIVEDSIFQAESISAFYEKLKSADTELTSRVEKVQANNKKLRYLASWEKGNAKIGFKEVDADDPFFSLKGSDNMIVITSRRYDKNPLIIWGPGAGAEVTAAGVLADIQSAIPT
jgi:aspartokinase/homoserine dehydrogenase 1